MIQQLQRNRDSSFQAVSCGEEYSSQREHKHFHSLNIENDLQIRFELPREGNFRLRLEQEITQVCRFNTKTTRWFIKQLEWEFWTKICFQLHGMAFFSSVDDVFFFTHFKQVPLARIMSLNHNRILSSIARVHVEPLGEPGELLEEHLRMTLEHGTTSQRLLIPIWVSAFLFW